MELQLNRLRLDAPLSAPSTVTPALAWTAAAAVAASARAVADSPHLLIETPGVLDLQQALNDEKKLSGESKTPPLGKLRLQQPLQKRLNKSRHSVSRRFLRSLIFTLAAFRRTNCCQKALGRRRPAFICVRTTSRLARRFRQLKICGTKRWSFISWRSHLFSSRLNILSFAHQRYGSPRLVRANRRCFFASIRARASAQNKRATGASFFLILETADQMAKV